MLGIYLFAAILGGGLLLFSVLAGGDHDAHADASGFDADHDIGHDVDHDLGHDADAGHGGAGELVLGLFRPRNLTFFFAAFGLTGSLLTLLSPWSATASLLPSLGMGLGAMVVTHGVFEWLRRSESAVDIVSDSDIEGCIGRVVLPLEPGERGRIACRVGDREIYMIATLAEGYPTLPPGREVVVLKVFETVAHVMPLESRELPPSTS
ncbi:MAG: hypothetical protein OER90_05235 [Gemmatimonadota bacterium]|nr:hypothetical protein [Gemmatimonadota bacterium]